jgi:hypothetical protein
MNTGQDKSWWQSEKVTKCISDATITIPVIVGATGTIKIFCDQIHKPLWKPIWVQVELSQLKKVPGSAFGATINMFCDQIHNLLWKLI